MSGQKLREAELADGTILEFPADTPDDVMQSAVKKYITASRSPAVEQPPVVQSDNRSATSVMTDQMDAAARGFPKFITGIPGFLKEAAGSGVDMLTGKGSYRGQKLLGETVKGIAQPFVSAGRGAAALAAPDSVNAPSREEWEQAAEGAGANLAGTVAAPIAGGIVRAAPSSVLFNKIRGVAPTAESLKARAVANRAASEGSLVDDAAKAGNSLFGAVRLGRNAYRKVAAPVQERIAGKLDRRAGVETPEQLYARQQLQRDAEIPAAEVPAEPLNVERPTTPTLWEQQLERWRAAETPEQLYARQQAQRDTGFTEPASAPEITDPSDFGYSNTADDFVYHVTTVPNAAKITKSGFRETGKRTVKGGVYENYSKNKVFFTERDGVKWWMDRIEEHLDSEFDNPPAIAVVRIPKSVVSSKLKPDTIGTKDSYHPSYFVDAKEASTLFAGPSSKLNIPRPGPQPIPTAAAPVNTLASIEEAIAPSGAKARKFTQMVDGEGKPTKFGRDLTELVPDIKTATKETAPVVLKKSIGEMETGIEAAESKIPPETPIAAEPIADKIAAIIEDFAGDERSTNQLTREWERWAGQKSIPWEEFRTVKRNVGKSLTTPAMRRMYRVLMDASSEVSDDLRIANHNYSVVRRAMENGGIDIQTGRRIATVGKPSR